MSIQQNSGKNPNEETKWKVKLGSVTIDAALSVGSLRHCFRNHVWWLITCSI